MRTVPRARVERIEFYESHVPRWADHAADIGLGPAAVHEFEALVAAAREAYLAAERARAAARAATQVFHERADAMGRAGAGLIGAIRAFAQAGGGAGAGGGEHVYPLAHLPPPAARSPLPPPGRPVALSVTLLANGALGLKWKCDTPAGSQNTVYEIRRRIGPGPFTHLGIAGERSFTDETLPAGAGGPAGPAGSAGSVFSGGIVYQITAVRSTARGEPARFLVNLGVDRGAYRGINPGVDGVAHTVHRLAG